MASRTCRAVLKYTLIGASKKGKNRIHRKISLRWTHFSLTKLISAKKKKKDRMKGRKLQRKPQMTTSQRARERSFKAEWENDTSIYRNNHMRNCWGPVRQKTVKYIFECP